MRRGGSIIAIDTITQDGLTGSDDLFVAISSEGEVFLYTGDNPEEIDTWSLVGRGQIPAPIGAPRCTTKYGADLIVMTVAGLVSLNSSLSSVFPGLKEGIMDKVSSLWEKNVRLYGQGSGWDVCMYYKRGFIIVNHPLGNGCGQMVLNPDTMAWVTLSGWEQVNCLVEFKGSLIAGGTGCVLHLDTLYQDYIAGEYVPVKVRIKHSFGQLSSANTKKRCTLARPYIVSSSKPTSYFGIAKDFSPDPTLALMYDGEDTADGNAEFFEDEWQTSEWSIGDTRRQVHTRWMQALACGYFLAPIIEIETTVQTVTYAGVEIQYETSNTI